MSRRWVLPVGVGVPLAFAALKIALQALAITNYGYFRDELYYIACAKHLAWGYVDQPPFSIAALALVRAVLGDSLVAIRLLPALSGAATVFLTGIITRDLGGGRFSQALACLCAVLAPVWLAVDHFFSMNSFDTFFWTLGAWLLLCALDKGRPRTWIALGVVLGLGTLNKISMLWFGGGAFVALLATSHRRVLLTKWPWIAGTIAALLVAPHAAWEWASGWPTLEFMRNASSQKMIQTGFALFWSQQVLVMNPATLPVWLTGLVALLAWRRTRVLGIVFLAVSALLITSGSSRPNYLAVAYAPLLAAGGVAIERAAAARSRAWLRVVALVAVAVVGAPVVPVGLPFLSADGLAAYLGALGMRPRAQERSAEGDLPQVFADMFGWEDMVRRVARVYHALPPDQRARCAIFADNYGEAGAIDFFGPRYGLPSAISNHNNYWLWGPRGATGEVLIMIGRSADGHADFRSATIADSTKCDHCMPFENDVPIYVCLDLNQPLARRWLQIRSYR